VAGLCCGVVMSEQAHSLEVPDELETYLLGGWSLNAWRNFLTTDLYTGEPNGHLPVP
jgi:hypothetical protein